MRRGEYGYDAPYALVIFGILSVATAMAATISWREGEIRVATQMTAYFVFCLANTSSFLYTTRRGKFVEWDRILDRLRLRGDERVLDIWSTRDQSGNARDVTELQVRRIARRAVLRPPLARSSKNIGG